MVEVQRKEVRVSEQFSKDIIDIYCFGEESFGNVAARSFIADIYGRIWGLDELYHLYPECRFLVTKSKKYRNIIIGAYLIIYKITPVMIDVLRIIHAHSSIRKIKKSRNIKV